MDSNMKLATFEKGGKEQWGVLITSPDGTEQLILCPQRFEDIFDKVCDVTSGHYYKKGRHFIPGGKWPGTIVDLLKTEGGLDALKQMHTFAEFFLFEEDASVRRHCTWKLDEVTLKAPIPRPRIYYGLVQNSTSFLRNNPRREHVNVYPQGHQRPVTTAVGAGEYLTIDMDSLTYGFNVEMGIVIGKQGRYVKAEDAMEYVAGYTNVIDLQQNALTQAYSTVPDQDWYIAATSSWMAKKQDTNCPMGPFLVTRDEIVNPYYLEAFTRENGLLRDRAHTSNMIIGIERLIEHYTSYCTIYPGDVLHLGTMGVDGKWETVDWENPDQIELEGEIEKLGALKVPVRFVRQAWSSECPEQEGTEPGSPVIRQLIAEGRDKIDTFRLPETNSFWTVLGNYAQCQEVEGLQPLPYLPRTLNNPASALTLDPHITLSRRATNLEVSAELCFVVKRVARSVPEEKAADYILGYAPMVSFQDQSFAEFILDPATDQERYLPTVYSRWADGTNLMQAPTPLDHFPRGALTLSIPGVGSVELTTADYICDACRQIAFMTRYLTLMPGDVVSLGRLSRRIRVDAETAARGFAGELRMEGFTPLSFTVKKDGGE